MAANESTTSGVRVIYSVPASAPRVIFIPIIRLWIIAVAAIVLFAWSGFSAWLLFARYDLTLANLMPGIVTAPAEAVLAVPAADAPRVPAAAIAPEVEVTPASVVDAPEPILAQTSNPISLPDGVVEPTSGSGVSLDLMELKWSGSKATVNFSIMNLTDELIRGRIVARGSFVGPNGEIVSAISHPELKNLSSDVESIPGNVGLAFSTRKQVSKSVVLESGSSDAALTSLEVMIADEAGTIKAVFRF